MPIILPQALEKLKGHIAFGLSVRPCFRSKFIKIQFLKFHIFIPHQKKLTRILFKSGLYPFVELCPF